MTPVALFTEVLAELEQYLERPTPYRLLRAMGLVRLLLTDGTPLAPRVVDMRTAWFSVEARGFRVSAIQSADPDNLPASGMYLTHSLRPTVLPAQGVRVDEFLAYMIASSNWTGDLTVKDVVRAATIAFGGVHLMTPSLARDRQVAATLDFVNDQALAVLTPHLEDIAHVTLSALRGAVPVAGQPCPH